MIYYLITIGILLFDQLLKYVVPKYSINIIDGIARLSYTENTGAAFGILKNQKLFLIIIGIVVITVILYFWHKISKDEQFVRLGLSLILGGSISNLGDRVFRGFVIDYIDFRIWPVFNFADVIINIGVFLIVIRILFYSKRESPSP